LSEVLLKSIHFNHNPLEFPQDHLKSRFCEKISFPEENEDESLLRIAITLNKIFSSFVLTNIICVSHSFSFKAFPLAL